MSTRKKIDNTNIRGGKASISGGL